MEQSEGRGKGKKVQDSSSNAEQSQAEMGQNVMDPQLRRVFSNRISAQRSRQKKVKLVEELEHRSKMLQDQLAQLQSMQAQQQSRMHSLMVEEQTLFHEMEYLQKKAILRDAEDEKNRKKKSRLEKLRDIRQQQLLNLHGPFAGLSIDSSSNQGGAHSSAAAVDEMMDQTNLSMATARNPNP